MSIPELCDRIQNTWLSRSISESTWGYPIVGALHVLAIALFGIAILIPHFRIPGFDVTGLRWIRRIGVALVLITGALVFVSGAARYYESTSFRIKMILLGLIALNAFVTSRWNRSKLNSAIAMVLWTAVIFASRAIAFF